VCELSEDRVGINNGEMVVDPFASGDVPFQETDEGSTTAQVLFIAVRTSPDGGVGGVWRRSLGWLWRCGKELSCEGVAPSAACLSGTMEVPERPLQLVFGGKDGQTLFVAGRTSLYAVHMRIKGR